MPAEQIWHDDPDSEKSPSKHGTHVLVVISTETDDAGAPHRRGLTGHALHHLAQEPRVGAAPGVRDRAKVALDRPLGGAGLVAPRLLGGGLLLSLWHGSKKIRTKILANCQLLGGGARWDLSQNGYGNYDNDIIIIMMLILILINIIIMIMMFF